MDSIHTTPKFLQTKQEIQWAKEMSSQVINFYDQPWSQNETVKVVSDVDSKKYDEKDMLGVRKSYVYLGSLRTGEISRLTTAKSWNNSRAKIDDNKDG